MLRHQIKRIMRGIGNGYRREILRDKPLLEAKRWFRDQGDTTLRLDYPLTKDSLVVDLGGYVGDWSQDIHDRFGCTVHLFEPVPALHARCEARFGQTPNVVAHRYGLSDKDGVFLITDDGDASSVVSLEKVDNHIECELLAADTALNGLGVMHIDLCKLNIEGGEYEVLRNLVAHGWLPHIRFLQIQFHTVGDYKAQRDALRAAFSETHTEQWCYEFVWESWARKS
jgi:FkbM family methyltransferase